MSIQFCELDQQVDRELLVSREEARGVKDERSLLVGVVESRPHSTPSHSQTSGQVGGAGVVCFRHFEWFCQKFFYHLLMTVRCIVKL
jgi:hypothetical protein